MTPSSTSFFASCGAEDELEATGGLEVLDLIVGFEEACFAKRLSRDPAFCATGYRSYT